ncbi:MAG: [Ni/Fe] hydrogenase small subunit, partial [Chloroflexi bacterium]|nr:[Ni/Fe] hydrogenase small subunit [Chloroflexota bacterium]
GATGVAGAVPGIANLVNMPGCPANVVNLVGVVVYLLAYNRLPELEGDGRPRFAYHDEVHKHCERKRFKDQDKYVLAWGDYGHQQGWCLKKMGCRGPDTGHNCPIVRWNEETSWPIGAGHHCIGCARRNFWDRATPFYARSSEGAKDDD